MIETPKVGDPSLVYMYGLSDFWVDMFGDKQLVETLLAGETIQLGEAYSYFLQRAAGISLADIQDKYGSRVKLLLLGESDLVDPSNKTKFKVDASIVGIDKLANRPILPTQTLSYGIHFDIDGDELTLYKPIDELRFPVRYNADGTWQYAIWMCDVEINDKWIENSFGRLVGFTEDDAIFNYKSFLEGVYFLYANGPNISFIERGVNLAMGMPYARATEIVLDVLQDEVTSNWIVFTSNEQYQIPYAFRPDIKVGDTLVEGQVLSTWVEVKDYSTSGAWWYQIYLPREVLGSGEDPFELGKAVEGSTADLMMKNFLKHHMFEVLITQPSSDITAFNTARGLVLRAKPEYTYPVFVWKASVDDEIINLSDDFKYTYKADRADYCISPPSIRFMDRSVDDGLFSRGTHWYNRVQGSMYAATLLGYGDWQGNAGWAPQFETITDNYLEYLAVLIRNRGDKVSPNNRGTIIRGWRSSDAESYESLTWKIPEANVYGTAKSQYNIDEKNLTPLYMMSRTELIDKMLTIDPRFKINGRNKFLVTGLNLVALYDRWMVRNNLINTDDDIGFNFEYSEGGLDIAFSPFAYQSYVPRKSDMYDSNDMPILDGMLLINRSTDASWVCQWVRNDVAVAPTLFPIEDQDHTRAIENYHFEELGTPANNDGVAINPGVTKIQTPRLVRGDQDVLVIVDGMYVNTFDYAIEFENTEAEIPVYQPEDPNTVDLGSVGRTYVVVDNTPTVLGYVAYDKASDLLTTEEFVEPETNGTYILSEQPVARYGILVISNGEFVFDYDVSGFVLTTNVPTDSLIIRYVSHVSEEVLPAGSSAYTLANDAHCKIFLGSRLLEDWAFTRNGTSIELSSIATDDLTVRYDSHDVYIKESPFTRSTVESNKARFLMDRSRGDGEYDDYLGQTVFMNRGGIPTLSNGSYADSVNVIRRLR